ncbi:hypothetical protein GLOTRDRAFT_140866 [Gloeophyllum trabeum ATCC 11539]|uniref:SUZ domain-containing protein n=1 Tax=Gloeophyllum trabeum (strain ATCC 11539 / FP-39264 / Madison 617) TaxID=670483 RepID=S7RCM1_GLOTA|nr:uncharacterized protein GLOTRDRAFT_140866 [Gloeophyllum trabeum ATCC 11539]EPQ51955.1 hypothetical protein GLOTRDRAFT_140866 [Gloeophyllum trabeum ATCC 11539]
MAAAATPDPWDQPSTSTAPRLPRATPASVPDDWDADTDSDEEDSRAVWEAANKKPPMPTILPAQSSTASTSLPPLEAIQPTLKILKRPSATLNPSGSPAGTGTGVSGSAQTLEERERSYREARERIFGSQEKEGEGEGEEKSKKEGGEKASLQVQVVRNPKGPERKGFERRRKKDEGGKGGSS